MRQENLTTASVAGVLNPNLVGKYTTLPFVLLKHCLMLKKQWRKEPEAQDPERTLMTRSNKTNNKRANNREATRVVIYYTHFGVVLSARRQ